MLVLLLALMLLPGRAVWAIPLDGGGILPAPIQPTQCVPPGVPPFSEWQMESSQIQIFTDERLRPQVGAFVAYWARGQRLHAFWLGRVLVTLDPAPMDSQVPAWHDAGAVLPDTTLRAERRQTCAWFTLRPAAPGET